MRGVAHLEQYILSSWLQMKRGRRREDESVVLKKSISERISLSFFPSQFLIKLNLDLSYREMLRHPPRADGVSSSYTSKHRRCKYTKLCSTWANLVVVGVGCETAGVAHLCGEDPWKSPEKFLYAPETAHTWIWRQHAHTHTHTHTHTHSIGASSTFLPQCVWPDYFILGFFLIWKTCDCVVSPNMMVSMPSGKGSTVGFPLTACLSVKGQNEQIWHQIITVFQQHKLQHVSRRGPLSASTRPHRSALCNRLTQASGSEPEASVLEDI